MSEPEARCADCDHEKCLHDVAGPESDPIEFCGVQDCYCDGFVPPKEAVVIDSEGPYCACEHAPNHHGCTQCSCGCYEETSPAHTAPELAQRLAEAETFLRDVAHAEWFPDGTDSGARFQERAEALLAETPSGGSK